MYSETSPVRKAKRSGELVELTQEFEMSRKRRKQTPEVRTNQVGYLLTDNNESICVAGYTSLDKNPEIMTACRTIAELIGSITIHLMANTKQGDVRIVNELSRAIDINPISTMTRSQWMEAIVMNLLLYGEGNSIVWPHTWDGLIRSLEPIAASRVSLLPDSSNPYRYYKIMIDGRAHDPENMIHFTYNPDKFYLWKGRGLTVSLRDVAMNLKQASATARDLGLTISSRCKLVVPKAESDAPKVNKFAKFGGGSE